MLKDFFMNLNFSHLVVLIVGFLIPVIIGLFLTRLKTVQYGMFLNRFIGTLLLQKRFFQNIPDPGKSILKAAALAIQTTFQDMSLGVYIDARKDLTDEEKQKKIDEYLGIISEP